MYKGDAMLDQVMQILGVSYDTGPPRYHATETSWVTKDNRVIKVVDMTDDHLRNTIRMLRRREELIRFSECMSMGRYQETAPDGAYDAIEWELSMIEKMDTDQYLSHAFKCFTLMLSEAERRGLQLEDA